MVWMVVGHCESWLQCAVMRIELWRQCVVRENTWICNRELLTAAFGEVSGVRARETGSVRVRNREVPTGARGGIKRMRRTK